MKSWFKDGSEQGAISAAVGWVAVAVLAIGVVVGVVVATRDGDPKDEPRPLSTEVVADTTSEEFDWGTQEIKIESEVEQGAAVRSYFVAEGKKKKLLKAAQTCVEEYLANYASATCYAFDTGEALEFADVDLESGKFAHVCWRAFFSLATSGGRAGEAESGQYKAEGCP